jgi:hypothetical protein
VLILGKTKNFLSKLRFLVQNLDFSRLYKFSGSAAFNIAQLLEIWLNAGSRNPIFMPSTIGLRQVMTAPTPMSVKAF